MLGELELRRRLKKVRGPVGVPLLFAEDAVCADSLAIARYADAHGSGPKLFPTGKDAEIERYNALSERGLAAGRALSLARVLQDEAALLDLVPRYLRAVLGPLAPAVAAFGVRRTLRKWGASKSNEAEHERVLREVLDTLRADLGKAKGKPAALLGAFSYADIAMAQVLVFIAPPAPGRGIKIGEASRRAFTHAALASEYHDLVSWRDALYEAHRKVS
jgi:glutathione S-transferase